ncbi:MAG: bifunctional riboflavin kinase/FAD synthetase [Clostridia bacterium]|nr:bifunctional riboflavin kinase/FAD synthetase [Clostridia bacterium]
MRIIGAGDEIGKDERYGVGLGNFDGVHRAHEFLITELVQLCKARGIASMIYTFREHPGNLLRGKKIKLISPLDRKIERFRELGVDVLCLVDFNREFANIDAEEFINGILKNKYNVELVVTGFNYNFGKGGRGNTDMLSEIGAKLGIDVVIVAPVMLENQIISSSLIREKLKNGHMESVANMLGRYYSIRGTVEYGNKIGTEIGFPTANIIPLEDFALPKSGVYYTKTIVDGAEYKSITNIGRKPTVTKEKRIIIETHIFDFGGWLYGKEIEVLFIRMIRNEKKFDGISELKEQILRDIDDVRKLF